MYYQESVIDGVLHYKTTPTSPWMPFSATSMTNKYIASQMLVKELTEQVSELASQQLIADGCVVSNNADVILDSDVKLSKIIKDKVEVYESLKRYGGDIDWLLHKISAYEEILEILES